MYTAVDKHLQEDAREGLPQDSCVHLLGLAWLGSPASQLGLACFGFLLGLIWFGVIA